MLIILEQASKTSFHPMFNSILLYYVTILDMFKFSLANYFHPIKTNYVLSLFIIKAEKVPNISNVFNADCRECKLPSNIRV